MKKGPVKGPFFEHSRELLRFAALFNSGESVNRREADENVDDARKNCHRTKDCPDKVKLCDAYKTPVKTAYNQKNPANPFECFHTSPFVVGLKYAER